MKICTNCGRSCRLDEFYTDPTHRDGRQSRCKECVKADRRRRYQTPEGNAKIRASNRAYWEKHKERFTAYARRLRERVLDEYGAICACCGETNREFLGIDHVFNDGEAHRKELGGYGRSIYRWLALNGFPKDRFQLLCHNCNMSKGLYGYCPHWRQLKIIG